MKITTVFLVENIQAQWSRWVHFAKFKSMSNQSWANWWPLRVRIKHIEGNMRSASVFLCWPTIIGLLIHWVLPCLEFTVSLLSGDARIIWCFLNFYWRTKINFNYICDADESLLQQYVRDLGETKKFLRNWDVGHNYSRYKIHAI